MTPAKSGRPARIRQRPASAATISLIEGVARTDALEEGLRIRESVLSPSGATVLGLYVYTAGVQAENEVKRSPVFRAIVPHLIGTPAIISARPGISQTQLAQYLGCERATAGKQVAECLRRGWIRRVISPDDKRKFSLYITPKGTDMLRNVVRVIPQHEREYTAPLTADERETLKRLLLKLIAG